MSADGEIVREALLYLHGYTRLWWGSEGVESHIETDGQKDDALAALARLEAVEEELAKAREGWDGWQRNALAAEAQRDALAEALRTIIDIGETRDVEVARAALADAGLIADSDTTTVFKQ